MSSNALAVCFDFVSLFVVLFSLVDIVVIVAAASAAVVVVVVVVVMVVLVFAVRTSHLARV